MSAGHSLRRENYTFPLIDARARSLASTEHPVPGPVAVIVTVAIAATFAFFAMDPSAAAWLRNGLLSLASLLSA